MNGTMTRAEMVAMGLRVQNGEPEERANRLAGKYDRYYMSYMVQMKNLLAVQAIPDDVREDLIKQEEILKKAKTKKDEVSEKDIRTALFTMRYWSRIYL
jgi:hypothetical protein